MITKYIKICEHCNKNVDYSYTKCIECAKEILGKEIMTDVEINGHKIKAINMNIVLLRKDIPCTIKKELSFKVVLNSLKYLKDGTLKVEFNEPINLSYSNGPTNLQTKYWLCKDGTIRFKEDETWSFYVPTWSNLKIDI